MNRSNKLRILATALFLVLICSACNHKPVTTVTPPDQPVQVSFGDQVIADAKTYGPVVEASLEEGIKQEALYATMKDADGNPIIPSAIEPQIRQWLIDAKKTVANFNAKAATWDHFDPNKRDDIDKFVRDALAFVEQVYNDGVLRIKNPQSQAIASGILSGAKITLVLWQTKVPKQGAQ
jgi:hypothetical protein